VQVVVVSVSHDGEPQADARGRRALPCVSLEGD
jgi:hypothetical protein